MSDSSQDAALRATYGEYSSVCFACKCSTCIFIHSRQICFYTAAHTSAAAAVGPPIPRARLGRTSYSAYLNHARTATLAVYIYYHIYVIINAF